MNTSDPKQQKQLVLLVVLALCLIGAIYYQTIASKPVLVSVNTASTKQKQQDANLVTASQPFIRPAGGERDPFVVPDRFDDMPEMAAPSKTTPGRQTARPTGLMPLPDLPSGGVVPGKVDINPGPSTTQEPEVVKTPPQFKLMGTIVGNHQMAIIMGANGGDQVAMGDQAADGSRLVAVTRETATFVKDGKSYTLTVGED